MRCQKGEQFEGVNYSTNGAQMRKKVGVRSNHVKVSHVCVDTSATDFIHFL